jgi:DNA-binding PadR family transcriptional regulator
MVNWAVLGLVIERPSYAYELSRRFERRFGEFLQAGTSRIYRALNRLEADRLIEPTDAPEGTGRQPKPHYRATAEGARAYRQWLAADMRVDPQRTELVGRLLAAGANNGATMLEIIDHYERACLEEASTIPVPQREPTGSPAELMHGMLDRLMAEERRLRLQAHMEWIEYARQELRGFTARSEDGER